MANIVIKSDINRIEIRDFPDPLQIREIDNYYNNLLKIMNASVFEQENNVNWSSDPVNQASIHPLPLQPLFDEDGNNNTMRFCCNTETFDDGFRPI